VVSRIGIGSGDDLTLIAVYNRFATLSMQRMRRRVEKTCNPVTRWDAFADLCGYLRASLLEGKPPRRRRSREWKLLIELSSFHYATPSLAGCVHDEAGIPREIREYLDAVLTLNGRRNAILLEALSRIVATLNAIDIEPVLMKGCARLVEGDYPQPNMRFLGDLDILVPANRAADAYAALMANGFGEKPEDKIHPPDHHHLRVLREHKTGAAVEIHGHVSPGWSLAPEVISTPWFCEGTRSFRLQDHLHVRLPDPTRNACHNVVHHQLNHDGYKSGAIELRQLLDLALIRKRHEVAIDWAELDHLFCRVGLGEVLATYLQFCEKLLGQKAPQLCCRPRVGAIESFRRIVDPPKPPKPPTFTPIVTALAAIVTAYATARRWDPAGVLKLLYPTKWPPRFKLLKDAFKPPRR
jgi:Uncharacterised nucleotidyltransferase